MAAMDPNAKYGNTSPVKVCSEAHGIPVDVGYLVADLILHGRRTVWTDRAEAALAEHSIPQHRDQFIREISGITARAV